MYGFASFGSLILSVLLSKYVIGHEALPEKWREGSASPSHNFKM